MAVYAAMAHLIACCPVANHGEDGIPMIAGGTALRELQPQLSAHRAQQQSDDEAPDLFAAALE
jgi:hypothetical protein